MELFSFCRRGRGRVSFVLAAMPALGAALRAASGNRASAAAFYIFFHAVGGAISAGIPLGDRGIQTRGHHFSFCHDEARLPFPIGCPPFGVGSGSFGGAPVTGRLAAAVGRAAEALVA